MRREDWNSQFQADRLVRVLNTKRHGACSPLLLIVLRNLSRRDHAPDLGDFETQGAATEIMSVAIMNLDLR